MFLWACNHLLLTEPSWKDSRPCLSLAQCVSLTSSSYCFLSQWDFSPLLRTLSRLASCSASGSPFIRENTKLIILWQTLGLGLYDRLRTTREVYQNKTWKSGYPEQLCPLWRNFDLTKDELQQRSSQPFKSSSLAISWRLIVAYPCYQLNNLDGRPYQIFQKYQRFKTFLEPCRPLSTYCLYDCSLEDMHSGFSEFWPSKACFRARLRQEDFPKLVFQVNPYSSWTLLLLYARSTAV